MTRRTLGFALSILAAASLPVLGTACTTKTITRAPAEEQSGDASAPDDTEETEETAPEETDAGVEELPTETVVLRGSPGQSCDDICGAAKYTCSATCEFGNSRGQGTLAGQATYSKKSNNFTSYEYLPLEACADVAPQSLTKFSETYTPDYSFGSPVSCCCQAPGRLRVEGDPDAPKSCSDVCKAEGRTCDPKTSWGFGDFGGARLTFACPGSTLLRTGDCTTVPAKTTRSGSSTCTLDSFVCGCL
jgi:hypothetical protein